jgi:hypothetical protein
MDFAAELWRVGLDDLSPIVGWEPALSIQRFLFAWWVFAVGTTHYDSFGAHRPEFPISPEDLRQLAHHAFAPTGHDSIQVRRWFESIQPDLYLDAEALRFWEDHPRPDPSVTPRSKRPFSDVLEVLRNTERYTLRSIIQEAGTALHRELAKPDFSPQQWEDLLKVPAMDQWAIDNLRRWRE